MTEPSGQSAADSPMTPEQEAELRRLADLTGEEIPQGMRQAEAAQRITELSAQTEPEAP